jgi:hypothetical protein
VGVCWAVQRDIESHVRVGGGLLARIGVLMPYPANDLEGQARIGAFQQELQQLGWAIGRNVRVLVGRGQCQRYSPARRGIGRARPRRIVLHDCYKKGARNVTKCHEKIATCPYTSAIAIVTPRVSVATKG